MDPGNCCFRGRQEALRPAVPLSLLDWVPALGLRLPVTGESSNHRERNEGVHVHSFVAGR